MFTEMRPVHTRISLNQGPLHILQYTNHMTGPPAMDNTVLVKFDTSCVAEIRRHKWIESEKAGRNIDGTEAKRDG